METNTEISGIDGKEEPDLNPYSYSHMIFDKDAVLSILCQRHRTQLYLYMVLEFVEKQ